MGEESNLVATLDNNLGFMNSFGDAYSIAELNSRPELRMQLEDCLKVANEKRRADKENNIKVKAKANFKLFAEPESAGWKGYSKVRAQLSSMIQFYGPTKVKRSTELVLYPLSSFQALIGPALRGLANPPWKLTQKL